jgi:hypothetical protein
LEYKKKSNRKRRLGAGEEKRWEEVKIELRELKQLEIEERKDRREARRREEVKIALR